MKELIEQFDINNFSKSPTIYQPEDLERLNHKLLIHLSFDEIKSRLTEIGAEYINENFWLSVRPNLKKLLDVKEWWAICHESPKVQNLDKQYLKQAAELLPEGILNNDSWKIWTKKIAEITSKKGKELFLPLRLALTGKESGPEMANILPLIERGEILKRLS